MVPLGLVGLLEFGEARALGVNGLEVIAQLVCDLVLIGQDEHAADRAEHLLLSLQRLQLIHRLKGQLGLNLLALSYLEGTVGNSQLLNRSQKFTLVLIQLKRGIVLRCESAYLQFLNLPLF